MKSSVFAVATAALLLAWNVSAQTATTTSASTSSVVALKAIQTLNCSKSNGTLQKMDEYDFASDGWCQRLCGDAGYPVMAMTAGSLCYCGSTLPALDQSVSQSYCNSPCAGYNVTNCGGVGYWQIYLDGLTNDVLRDPNTTTTSTSATSTVTKAPATVVVTTSASTSGTAAAAADAAGTGSNKVGIAVGVVVGLVVLAGLVGATVFYMKRREKKAIEAEHHRLEAQAAAAAAEKSDTASVRTDQRLDPSNIFSHRRESIGSIADEMDFSRRILQVRNPDRFSTNSPVP